MNKFLITAAGLITGAAMFTVASPAMAAHVNFGINVGVPAVYSAPAPVYVEPQPAYVEQQQVYMQPQPVYVETRPVYGPSRVAYEDRGWHRDWRDQERREYEWRREHERDYGRYDRDDRRQEYRNDGHDDRRAHGG
jgi:hypothetical protein